MNGLKYCLKFILCVILIFCTGYFSNGIPGNKTNSDSLNLGFEKALDGWTTGGTDYKIETVTTGAANGKQCLRLMCMREKPTRFPGFASIQLPFKRYRGKRIRLSALLKTKNLQGRYSLWIRADNKTGPTAFEQTMRGPTGNIEWKEYTVEMDIPHKTRKLYAGVMVTGTGTALADSLRVEIFPARNHIELSISGQVVDKSKKPVSGALVAASAPFNESAQQVVSTDEKGKFKMYLLPGKVRFTATARDFVAGHIPPLSLKKNMGDIIITLDKPEKNSRVMEGKIKTQNGKIPGKTYVSFKPMDFVDTKIYYIKPGTGGSFRSHVPEGMSYKLELESPTLAAPAILVDTTQSPPGSVLTCSFDAITPKAAPTAVVDWMKKNAVPLQSVTAGTGFADMEPLKRFIGNARMVALGESTHGTREMFQMKHRFFEFLVEKMGFTVFGFESEWADSLALNDYVLNGKGDAAIAVSHLSEVWNTEEVLELIKWMRAYNADPAHTKKVKVYGVDVGGSRISTNALLLYLEKVDRGYGKTVTSEIGLLRAYGSYGKFLRLPKAEQDALVNSVGRLIGHVSRNKNIYRSKSSSGEYRLNFHHAVTLRQFLNYIVEPNDYRFLNIRTRTMAENANWIMDNEGPGTRMVLWAHNFHISLSPYPGRPFVFMGMHLRRMLGKDFMSIGFAFNRGGFQGLDFRTPSPRYFLWQGFRVGPYTGSYGNTMARTGLPLFYLDLRCIPVRGAVHDWFARPKIFRWINAIYDGEEEINHMFHLPSLHDGVIFIENTERARPLPGSGSPPVPY